MTRDMDLIRALLLNVEAMDVKAGAVYSVGLDDEELKIEGFSEDQIFYNFRLMVEHGLVSAPGVQGGGFFMINGLSWQGHELLENIRNPAVWSATKSGVKKVGGVGLDLVLALAKAEGKRLIAEKLGIPL